MCVTAADAGDVFGEMSLLNGVEWRLASVITDESCQLLVLSQQLFDRYIKQHASEMYSEKSRFVLTNPYLKSAPSAFKTSLVILMRKKSLGYNELLIRQGQTINSVYFILRSAANFLHTPCNFVFHYDSCVSWSILYKSIKL